MPNKLKSTELYEETERLNKMRQDFVANVSHELRTPLTVIHGYVEALLGLPNIEPSLKDIFGKVSEQTKRMEHLVGDLLLLSRIETEETKAQFEPVNVKSLLEPIKQDAENISRGAHYFSWSVDPALTLLGSLHELRSAFSNLIMNAISYTKPGGKIAVSWFCDHAQAYFKVSDTGIGIEAKHIERLTERFYRVDKGRSRQSGGTGLGLAIVKHVLMRHDANLEVSSQVNVGSEFSCVFPSSRFVAV